MIGLLWLLACQPDVAWIGDAGYASVQAAIDRADDDALIEVAPGVYVEALRVDHPLTLQGLHGGVTLSGGGTARVVDATAPVTLLDLNLEAGFAERGAALRATSGVHLERVAVRGCRGLSLVEVTGELFASELTIDADHPGDALVASLGDADLRATTVRAAAGAGLLLDGGALQLTDVSVTEAPMGSALRGDSIAAQRLSVAGDLTLSSPDLAATDVRAGLLYASGAGELSQLTVSAVVSDGVDLRDVIVRGSSFALVRATAVGAVVLASDRPIELALADATLRNALLLDVDDGALAPTALHTGGDVVLEHLTWVGGHHDALATGGSVRLDQSVLASLRLRRVGPVTSAWSYAWGDGLPAWSRRPWEVVAPQLDGVELSADSALWGLGPDGEPGAFGGVDGAVSRAAWERAQAD